jgi:outer membrane protein assembly factor BamB
VRHFVAIGTMVSLLVGCASSSQIQREEPTPLVDLKASFEVKEIWSVNVGASARGRDMTLVPVVDGDAVIAAGRAGRVSAIEAATGRLLWEARVNVSLSGAVGTADGLVVVASDEGKVFALDRAKGTQRWEAQVSSTVLAPPAVGAGIVVVQSQDGAVTGFSGGDGQRLWRYERSEPALSLRGTATPLILGNQVLAGFASGKIAVLGLRDGKLLTEIMVAEPRGRNEIERLVDIDAAPLFAGDLLYAVSFQGKLVAIDPQAGRTAWTREMSSFTGMAADRSNLYVTDDKGQVLAFDLRTGASVWKQDKLRARRINAPAYHDGYIAVGDFEGYIHWLAREDGHLVARTRVGGDAIRAPAQAVAQTLFVANEDGTLAALRRAPK